MRTGGWKGRGRGPEPCCTAANQQLAAIRQITQLKLPKAGKMLINFETEHGMWVTLLCVYFKSSIIHRRKKFPWVIGYTFGYNPFQLLNFLFLESQLLISQSLVLQSDNGLCFLYISPLRYKLLVFLPGRSRGQRSLAGYGVWDHKELDTTERLSLHLTSY